MARTVSPVKTLTNTSTKTLLYKVPSKNTGIWNMMYILGVSGTETVKVFWKDFTATPATEYTVVYVKNQADGNYTLISDAVVALKENDEIWIQNAGTSSTVTYIATLELRPAETIQFHG